MNRPSLPLSVVLPSTVLLYFLACSSDSQVQPDADAGADSGHDGPAPAPDAGPRPVNCVGTTPYDAWVSDRDLCVYVFATGLGRPRQMAFAPNGDLFVNNGSVTVLWDDDKNGQSDESDPKPFAVAPGLNHGLAFSRDASFVYASSSSTVYRWPYTAGARTAAGPAEIVVKNMPADGNHVTRTLVFDAQDRLYVNVGSSQNVDTEEGLRSTRAQIRRFTLASVPPGGIDYAAGEVAAHGMRNEVGLFVDAQDRLWGVENGRENLSDPDYGDDISNDNPGEEINVVDAQGANFYGYPDCYSEFSLANGKGRGTEWADQTIHPAKSDAWCQDGKNVRPPLFVMQAHWAPLGIFQYTGNSLPFSGDFLVTSHGSGHRDPPAGRLIARARYQNGTIVSVEPIVGAKDASGGLAQGADGAPRPVDIRQGPDAAMYYSDDLGGRVFKVGYRLRGTTPADSGTDAASDAGGDCAVGADGLPSSLRCTGLYSDFANKTISSDVFPYTPGVELWSDGAEKQRYLYLPPGTTIDTADMAEWRFPVGTKVWKEFRIGGTRVETRIYFKRLTNEWSWTTYRWAADASDAVRLDAGATNVVGSYEIPSRDTCIKCHGGRTDRLLGVEAIALALPTAAGLTLDELVKKNALSSPPARTRATLPEDMTGKAGPALGFLHMNCGVSCHNGNPGANAFLNSFRMRLPAAEILQGTAQVDTLETWTTGAGVTPEVVTYKPQIDEGYKRIFPGQSSKSLAVHVVSLRGKGQMPPLVSHEVDTSGVKSLRDWIDAR